MSRRSSCVGQPVSVTPLPDFRVSLLVLLSALEKVEAVPSPDTPFRCLESRWAFGRTQWASPIAQDPLTECAAIYTKLSVKSGRNNLEHGEFGC